MALESETLPRPLRFRKHSSRWRVASFLFLSLLFCKSESECTSEIGPGQFNIFCAVEENEARIDRALVGESMTQNKGFALVTIRAVRLLVQFDKEASQSRGSCLPAFLYKICAPDSRVSQMSAVPTWGRLFAAQHWLAQDDNQNCIAALSSFV
jgi:hypothetical protein